MRVYESIEEAEYNENMSYQDMIDNKMILFSVDDDLIRVKD